VPHRVPSSGLGQQAPLSRFGASPPVFQPQALQAYSSLLEGHREQQIAEQENRFIILERTLQNLTQQVLEQNSPQQQQTTSSRDPLTPVAMKKVMHGFVNNEIAMQNIILQPGGVRANADVHAVCFKSFVAHLRRQNIDQGAELSRLFRACFGTVVKSQRKKKDPVTYSKAKTANTKRQWRWRLATRMIKALEMRTLAEDTGDAESLERQLIVLQTAYMPEIHLEEDKTFVYLALPWLSAEAKLIQLASFKGLRKDSAYPYR
jgi:hypothetical protein